MQTFFLYIMQLILISKRNAILKKRIKGGMKVIGDFGCGHFPSKFATVAVDQAESIDEQRGGLKLAGSTAHREFHSIDLNQFPYPFPDKHFDFIICSHVLEHLDDPVKVCAEFSRIAKAGYIEVPYYCVDLFIRNNDIIHKWLCSLDPAANSITFMPRKDFLEQVPPRSIGIISRFMLQLQNIHMLWDSEISAGYLHLNHGPAPVID